MSKIKLGNFAFKSYANENKPNSTKVSRTLQALLWCFLNLNIQDRHNVNVYPVYLLQGMRKGQNLLFLHV